jgi:hypothetical protein
MDVGKDSGKKPNGVNFLTIDMTEGVPSACFRGSALSASHIADKRSMPELINVSQAIRSF